MKTVSSIMDVTSTIKHSSEDLYQHCVFIFSIINEAPLYVQLSVTPG